MSRCGVLIDPPQDGAWNMAVDEVLLGRAALGVPQLRVYRWSKPTLSLGHFQKIAERQLHPPSLNCAVVRRSTGGGAIMHDREITYALALPWSGGTEGVAKQRQLYGRIHAAFVEMLQNLGVRAEICPTAKEIRPVPFLCFQRVGEGDVMLGSSKIAGSAQRRVKGALLQHGSLLLETTPAAPELPGMADLSGVKIRAEEIVEMLPEQVVRELGWKRVDHPLNEVESQIAQALIAARFGNAVWTERR